jgi:hypothetical protein
VTRNDDDDDDNNNNNNNTLRLFMFLKTALKATYSQAQNNSTRNTL